MKSLFLFFAFGEKGNQESMTVLFYQFHNIPIWLLEYRVVYDREVSAKGNRQLFSSGHFMNNEKAVGLGKTEKRSHLYLLITRYLRSKHI